MGSDDGAKGREGKGAASLGTLLFLVCFVAPMLLVEQYLVRRRGLTLAKLKGEVQAVRAHPGQAIGDAVRIVEGEARDAIERGRNLERHIEAMLHRQRPPDAPQVVATPVIAPKPTKPLREMLLDLALLAPRDALAALDKDPLGVERVTNASEWRCPAERLLSSSNAPSREALRRMRENRDGAFLWFDHLSKAGGTSFCKFARKNVGFKSTPRYYCMPSDGADIPGTDGRVGRWPASQLREYLQRTRHRVVASEWDPFPAQMLADFKDDAVLASIIRDPLDRLVSAHKFWGVLNNPAKNAPDPVKWLRNMDKRARARTMAQAPRDYLQQVARNNFATWKFAFSTDGRFHDCKGDASCSRAALEAAVNTLSRFHVLAPTTWQAHAGPLYARLGWSKLEEEHVVNIGTVQDSSSRRALPDADYAALREANVLDEILWHWARRAFLESLHCAP